MLLLDDAQVNELFCGTYGAYRAFGIVGMLINLVKIIVPLIIIVIGMLDIAKAVTSGDDKALSAAVPILIKRIVIGILLFFVPTILAAIFQGVGFNISESSGNGCWWAIYHPTDAINKANEEEQKAIDDANSKDQSTVHESSSGTQHGGGGKSF